MVFWIFRYIPIGYYIVIKQNRRFNDKENVSGVVQAKSTVIKATRAKQIEDYPYIEDYIDDILPKKDNVRIIKW